MNRSGAEKVYRLTPHACRQEFEYRGSAEGRLVRRADRIELFLQALVYERTSANQSLDEFWGVQEEQPSESGISQQLFEALEVRG